MLTGRTFWLGWTLVLAVSWTARGHEGHEHYVPREDHGEDLDDQRFTRDTKHIKEDIEKYFKMNWTTVDQLDPDSLDYYYFELHDFDQNSKLDGLELLKAIQHVVEHTSPAAEEGKHLPVQAMLDNFSKAIDQVLQSDDLDNDGFLSYMEYAYAKQRHERPQPQTTTTAAPV